MEPEELENAMENVEGGEWETTDEKCEVCGGPLKRSPQPDGPDDYHFVYVCQDCGATYD
jgi:hypothetical protein